MELLYQRFSLAVGIRIHWAVSLPTWYTYTLRVIFITTFSPRREYVGFQSYVLLSFAPFHISWALWVYFLTSHYHYTTMTIYVNSFSQHFLNLFSRTVCQNTAPDDPKKQIRWSRISTVAIPHDLMPRWNLRTVLQTTVYQIQLHLAPSLHGNDPAKEKLHIAARLFFHFGYSVIIIHQLL